MKVADLILELQKIEDQSLIVYKVNGEGSFVPMDDNDVAELTFGEPCDENGDPIDLDEFPILNGMRVVCINMAELDCETEAETETNEG